MGRPEGSRQRHDRFAEARDLADTHLVLAGPAPSSVADDPEAQVILDGVRERWASFGDRTRARVHIANLPVDDSAENALVVNALQRRADVVVQKSLAEGFGLTVTEAMWKCRPVVAGGVGGIRDQIDDDVSGVLIDPGDLESFGAAVAGVIRDPARAATLGEEARRRVQDRYLPALPRRLSGAVPPAHPSGLRRSRGSEEALVGPITQRRRSARSRSDVRGGSRGPRRPRARLQPR